jgi:hypothetical protein
VKAPHPEIIRQAYRKRILETAGVSELASLELDFDSAERALDVSFKATTDAGELAVAIATEVGA